MGSPGFLSVNNCLQVSEARSGTALGLQLTGRAWTGDGGLPQAVLYLLLGLSFPL